MRGEEAPEPLPVMGCRERSDVNVNYLSNQSIVTRGPDTPRTLETLLQGSHRGLDVVESSDVRLPRKHGSK